MAGKPITKSDRERSDKARRARESGRSLGNYTREIVREMTTLKKRAGLTPSKKA